MRSSFPPATVTLHYVWACACCEFTHALPGDHLLCRDFLDICDHLSMVIPIWPDNHHHPTQPHQPSEAAMHISRGRSPGGPRPHARCTLITPRGLVSGESVSVGYFFHFYAAPTHRGAHASCVGPCAQRRSTACSSRCLCSICMSLVHAGQWAHLSYTQLGR